ncbi:P1 family peptidase [Tengunoibacter tsumagoiensis]|uniref:Peptidase T4 n=1 Tax=Tengunoibacter tsumagoiensis TaxID=2014871 RepID=A0A402A772_9CHLR|nr:P1 family peptidase [Tengunoibacter tsumagoiensis]GCE14990.1 peptidase T4 [Tengunoibacter tsumagoiensis]
MLMNSSFPLVPQTSFEGPTLEFNFPALHIGIAEYAEGPTGCTIFYFPDGVATAKDARGGLVVTSGDYERDHLKHAFCFAGGSVYGLEAASGVTAALFEQRAMALQTKAAISSQHVAVVSGAILNDYIFRENIIYPDHQLGKAALLAARPGLFPLGARGAGRSVTCGNIMNIAHKEASGQGGAFRQIGPTKIGVFTVVNAVGVIVNRQGQIVRGNRDPKTGLRLSPIEELEQRLARGEAVKTAFGNTTLTLVVTNQRLRPEELRQVGRHVHSSMSRAIQPFQTLNDGDVLYTATTNEVENSLISPTMLGILASELAWDAVLASGPTQ